VAQAEHEFRAEFSAFVRDHALRENPCLAHDASQLGFVTEDAFRLLFQRAGNKNQKSLSLSDFSWAISTACLNQRLAAYLPRLRSGLGDTEFYLDFFDRALRHARKVYRQRDPDQAANLQEDDLQTAVEDAFLSLFGRAAAGDLQCLTWSYVKAAIWFALTPLLRRGWDRPPGEGPLPPDGPQDPHPPRDPDKLLQEWCDAAGLDEQETQVVRAKLLDKMTWEEVAESLDASVGVTRRLYRSGVDKLKDWLSGKNAPDPPP